MRRMLDAIRATLIGGILFLVPVGIVIVVMGKLIDISARAGRAIHNKLMPGVESDSTALVIAILFLLAVAYLAGLFGRTIAGRRTFGLMERLLLARLPFYSVFRHVLGDFAGGSQSLLGIADTKVVKVRLDDMWVIGFLVDTRPNGDGIVYMPGAPSALSGSVALFEADRIEQTSIAPAEVISGMRRLGSGLVELNRQAHRAR